MKAKKILLAVLSLVLVFSALAIVTSASTANSDGGKETLSEVNGTYVEGYGIIPETYASATAYPIVIFQNGEFKTAFAKDEFHKALAYPRDNLGLKNETDPAPAKILLRGDASLTTKDENLGQTAGTIDVNLNGFTLTNAQSSYLFNGIAKTINNFAQKFTLNVYNGNIVLGGQFLYIAAQNGGNTTGPLKDMEFNFTNVNISLSGPMGTNSWFVVSGDGKVSGTSDTLAQYDVRMNDCVLDFTQLNKANQIFQLTAAYTDINFEINGGKLIAGQGDGNGTHPWRTALYSVGSNAKITFNKGSNGKYLTLVAHTDINSYISKGYDTILDRTAFNTKSGATAEFINPVTEGDWVTYTLQADEYVDGYGTIPLTYADFDTHPIVLFLGGEFQGAYTKSQFTDAMKAARSAVASEGTAAAQILLRGNVEATGNDQNLGASVGTIDVNLNGFTVTQTDSTQLFFARTKTYSATAQSFTLNVYGGEIIVRGNLLALGTQSNGTYDQYKSANINFTNVKLTSAAGVERASFLAHFTNGTLPMAMPVYYNFAFNNCVFNMSGMLNPTNVLDFKATSETTPVAATVSINGGEMVLGTASVNSVMYKIDNNSTVTFGKGSDGNYLKITAPTDVTPSMVNTAISLDNGVECVYVKASANDTTATYKLMPKVMVDYKIKTSVTLYSNFVYNVYIPVANVNGFTVNGSVVEYTTETIDSVEYYVVKVDLPAGETLKDIALTVTLNSGNTTVDANWTLSVYNYTKSVLAGDYNDTTKTLMKDMLVYASAAHTYFENTEAVAEKLAEIKNLLGDYNATLPTGEAKAPADKTYFADVAVYLGEVPSFRFYLASGYTAADFTFKVGNRAVDVIASDDGKYVEIVMYAYMMLDDVTFTVKSNGATGTYNLYSYLDYAKNVVKDANLVAVVEALMKYSVSAKAYRTSVVNK